MSPLERLIRRIGRHGSVYLAASGLVGVAGVAQVSVLTRLLSPAEFGQLAVLTVFSVSLTVVLNLGSLQGSFRSVFGTAGEEDVDEAEEATRGDPRRALGNALALTAALGLAGSALVAAGSVPLSELLLGDSAHATAVALAGLAGGLGAVWRLAVNVPRLERRAGTYAIVNAGRALLVLSGMTLAVALGGGVEAAVAGMAAGTAAGLALALVGIRRSFTPTLAPREWPRVLALGAGLIPVVLASWAIQNGDVLILSGYASEAEVGIYRAGARIAALVAYATSALLMAWGPLTREPLYAAVDARHGPAAAGARLATWFLAACLTLLLAVALLANELVRIAGESFHAAADIIPLVAAGLVAHAQFVAVYRVARFPHKRRAFVALSVLAALVFVGAAFVLVPPFEGTGAALAILVGYSAALAGMVLLSQRGDRPLPLDWPRLGLACGLFASALAAGLAARELPAPAATAGALAAVVAYPLALLATAVVPRAALGMLRARRATPDPDPLLDGLTVPELRLLRAAFGGDSRASGAPLDGGDEALRRVTAALRTIAPAGAPHDADAAVARHLLGTEAPAERDRVARRLWSSDGVDPLELEALAACADRLRELRAQHWDEAIERALAERAKAD